MTRKLRLVIGILVGLGLICSVLVTPMVATDSHGGRGGTRLYIPPPQSGAVRQIAKLWARGHRADARLITEMVLTPQAVWIEGATPREARREVQRHLRLARLQRAVPTFVAYNIPFRDCSQFSAGGATSVAEYKAWIDGMAAGIGNAEATVILEPDGLGIIPWYDPFGAADGSSALEWCQPAEARSATAAADRFEMLNYAVDAFAALARTKVYLDATHSAWLNVGDASHRLAQAGIARADGFFLNISNYQYSSNLVLYGTWISSCLSISSDAAGFFNCPNQYWNGGPDGTKIAELLGPFNGVALSNYGIWSDDSDDPALNTSGINARYAGATPTTHFVIDTSRNGQGPWQFPAGTYADPQDWCNPPDRGLGLRPTTNTGNPLVDAYLWVKIPGASDGECTRGIPGAPGTVVDPEWGIVDPGAGDWFPQMALELVHNAKPPLD